MGAGYWKMVGENIARGAGKRAARRIGSGARFLGRAGAVVGIGVIAYELYKNYKQNIKKEPAFGEMMVLQAEMVKWTSAISCLGREAYAAQDFASMDEGGAINALFPRKGIGGGSVKPPDPKLAAALVKRAGGYIRETENLSEAPDFEMRKAALVEELESLSGKINNAENFRPIQQRLSKIVTELKPIETGCASRIHVCSRDIQKRIGSNAAWAALSTATFGLVKKPPA